MRISQRKATWCFFNCDHRSLYLIPNFACNCPLVSWLLITKTFDFFLKIFIVWYIGCIGVQVHVSLFSFKSLQWEYSLSACYLELNYCLTLPRNALTSPCSTSGQELKSHILFNTVHNCLLLLGVHFVVPFSFSIKW